MESETEGCKMKQKRTARCLKKLFYVFCIAVLCRVSVRAEAAESEEEKISIYFFHNTACGTCDGTEEFVQIVKEQIAYYKDECPYELRMYNVFTTTGNREWEKVKERYGFEKNDYVFPVMVLNEKMYTGMDEIEQELHEAFLKAADVSAVYFYRKDCQECMDMKEFWEVFPETFMLDDTEEAVRFIRIETRTEENGALIRKLFDAYEVPEEDQMVPIVFLADEYLAGQTVIEEKLYEALECGHGFKQIP